MKMRKIIVWKFYLFIFYVIDIEYWKLADVKRYRNWLKILLKLIHNDDWETARLFYSVLNEWVQDFEYYEYHESFDLKPLCNINKMQQHRWVSDLIHELIMNGSDIHTLLIEKGEPFLHACIRVTYATGRYYICNTCMLTIIFYQIIITNYFTEFTINHKSTLICV